MTHPIIFVYQSLLYLFKIKTRFKLQTRLRGLPGIDKKDSFLISGCGWNDRHLRNLNLSLIEPFNFFEYCGF